jgi:transposase
MCSFIDFRTKRELRNERLRAAADEPQGSEVMGEHRRFTAEQKLAILKEAEQPGVTISEVCRRHGLAASLFYRWRAVADDGSATALKGDGKRAPRKGGLEARHQAEIDRLRAVVAEITAENLELKKKL